MATTRRRYIYPPRATTAIPRAELNDLPGHDWIAQLKYNDSHLMLDYENGLLVQIWDRHNKNLIYDPTHLTPQLNDLGTKLIAWGGNSGRYLLDGGLMHNKHAAIKDTIVLWDCLVKGGEHQTGTTYRDRLNDMHHLLTSPEKPYTFKGHLLGWCITPNIFIVESFGREDWNHLWDIVEDINKEYAPNSPLLEGLMLKMNGGVLEQGLKEKNNDSWLTRSRVKTGRHQF